MNRRVQMRGDDATSRRILIASIHYWPELTGIAPYATGVAEHRVALGDHVDVLTVMPFYPDWRIHPSYRRRLRRIEEVNRVRVYRTRHYIPNRQSALRRSLYEASFLLSAPQLLTIPKPDVIIGIVPALSGALLASLAARRFRVPYGLIIQDLSSPAARQSGIQGGGGVAGLVERLESRAVRGASEIAIIAEGFRPYLEQLGVSHARIHRVRNWTHIGAATRDTRETRTELGLPLDAFICLHAGNMGLKQGLENVVETARLAAERDPELFFAFVGGGNQRQRLEIHAAGLSNVRFLPTQSETAFPDLLHAADVLLVNQRPSVIDMSLPGKLTSYFASGRPVVAAVNGESETAAELALANSGIVVPAGRPDELLAGIEALKANPQLAETLADRAKTFALEHLTEDAALAELDAFIDRIAKNS